VQKSIDSSATDDLFRRELKAVISADSSYKRKTQKQ